MLDVKTMFLVWVIQAGTMAILLIVVWFNAREQRYFLWFGLGFAMHATGLGLIGARGQIPDFISIQIANSLCQLSFGLWVMAVAALNGRKAPTTAWVPLLIWIIGNLIPAVRDSFDLRVTTYNLGAAFGFGLLAILIFRANVSSARHRLLLSIIWGGQSASAVTFAIFVIFYQPASFQDDVVGAWLGTVTLIGFVSAIVVLAKMLMDRSEERLQTLVRTDPLTGALNRRGFTEAYQRLRDAAPSETMGLLIFDLDHFKQVNDEHGHGVGDHVLIEFVGICKALLPQGAAFGRTGGEEFAAVLAISEARDAALFAETVRLSLADQKIETQAKPIQVTTSIGIAFSSFADADLQRLMSGADDALYASKTQGRNRTSVKVGERIVTVPPSRVEPIDNQADRQVAILKRIASVASKLHD